MGYYFYGRVILWDFIKGEQKEILSGLLKKTPSILAIAVS